MDKEKIKESIKTLEYMLVRCPYNERQRKALETALEVLKQQLLW